MKEDLNCDEETGLCSPAPLASQQQDTPTTSTGVEVIYIGDPMCSWCWGISKDLFKLRAYQKATQGTFKIVVGGLRPGGGDAWNDEFKGYLKHHWEQVNKASGQPFGTKLLDRDYFNYDTEPPCRAIVAARPFLGDKTLEFFDAVHEKFYVHNEDPNELVFYESICNKFTVDFKDFTARFKSNEVKAATREEFVLNRSWGVRGYPSVLVKIDNVLYPVTQGYATFEQMKYQFESIKLKAVKA